MQRKLFHGRIANPSYVDWHRRDLLKLLGTGALGLMLPGRQVYCAQDFGSKTLRGIFPIAQTPFTNSNELDLDVLVEQLKFIDRGRVHGFVWPQLASEWQTLTERERLAGMEAIAAAGKQLRPAVVLGVQAPEPATAVAYAKHAEQVGADAIISLPPSDNNDLRSVLDYYRRLGGEANLPLFVQSSGDMSVEAVLDLYRQVPTLRYVKDEAGRPLDRIRPLRERSDDEIKVFSGAHGRTLIEEMRRGSSGSMPAASFADLYAQTWDLWQQGQRGAAMEMHAKTLLLLTEMTNHGSMEAMKYLLFERGVFKTYAVRQRVRRGAAGQTPSPLAPLQLDDAGKQSLRETLAFVKPYLRA